MASSDHNRRPRPRQSGGGFGWRYSGDSGTTAGPARYAVDRCFCHDAAHHSQEHQRLLPAVRPRLRDRPPRDALRDLLHAHRRPGSAPSSPSARSSWSPRPSRSPSASATPRRRTRSSPGSSGCGWSSASPSTTPSRPPDPSAPPAPPARTRSGRSRVWETPPRAAPGPGSRRAGGRVGLGQVHLGGARYRAQEIVSSDALRGVVGSGQHDLDASADAFAVLETVVAARLGRGLTTVVDTLGLDAERRRAWLAAARAAGLPAVVVVLTTPAAGLPAAQRARATGRCPPRCWPGSSPGWPPRSTSCAARGLGPGRRARRLGPGRSGGRPATVSEPAAADGRSPAPRRGSRWCSRCPASRGARTRWRGSARRRPGRRRGGLRRTRR